MKWLLLVVLSLVVLSASQGTSVKIQVTVADELGQQEYARMLRTARVAIYARYALAVVAIAAMVAVQVWP